jgi:hypothetical protein
MTKPDLVNLAPAQCTTCRSAVPGAIRGEGAAPTIIDLDFEQDVLSETKRIDREMMPPDGKLRAYTCCVVRNMLKFIRD